MLWSSPTPVTPLGCALTKNAPVSALKCAHTNSLDLKSFGIRIYTKVGGRGGSARTDTRYAGDTRSYLIMPSARAGLTRMRPQGLLTPLNLALSVRARFQACQLRAIKAAASAAEVIASSGVKTPWLCAFVSARLKRPCENPELIGPQRLKPLKRY